MKVGRESIYQSLVGFLDSGEAVAVATVVRTRGSVPREVGAKMLIHPGGQHVGTIGGGCGEAEVIRAALDVVHTGQPTVVEVDLTQDISMESEGVCGGIMDVFVERWSPQADRAAADELLPAVLESVEKKRSVALVTVVAATGPLADRVGRRAVLWLDGEPLGELGLGEGEAGLWEAARQALRQRRSQLVGRELGGESAEVFVEVQSRPPTLLIVGAGHIAQPLAQLGRLLDFEVVVLDDRPSFANEQRFPTADRVIVADFETALRDYPVDQDTYIVLITRGHQHDVPCLREVIDSPAAYIGMIGSRRRVNAVFQLLEQADGVPAEKLRRVYSPIGLDIEAETPAEIALAIAAEIVKVRRGGSAASLSDDRRRERS